MVSSFKALAMKCSYAILLLTKVFFFLINVFSPTSIYTNAEAQQLSTVLSN